MLFRTLGWLSLAALLGASCSSSDREFGSNPTPNGGDAGAPGMSGGADDGASGGSAGGSLNEGGTMTTSGTGAGGDLPMGLGGEAGGSEGPPLCSPEAAPARLLAPLSSSIVTSLTPLVRWEVGDDCGPLTVDFCSDRACTQLIESVRVAQDADSASPTSGLPRGVVFWRVRGSGVVSKVWQFNVGTGTPVDTSYGTLPDFNGDGFGDVAVGATDGSVAGSVYVYYGNKSGLDATPTVLAIAQPQLYAFGLEMASAGDVNGDGFTDLVVGAPQLSGGGGKLVVFLGSEKGVISVPFATLTAGDLQSGGDPSYAGVGSVLRGGADINQDGYADFVVSAPLSGNMAGSLTPYFGSVSKISAGSAIYFPGSIASFGQGLSLCDVNADSISDLIVGAPGAKNGNDSAPVAIYEGTGVSFVLTQQLTANAGFGRAVACGDYAHDGYADVVASWPSSGERGYEDGDVWLYPNLTGTVNATGASLPLQGSGSYINSGRIMATVGDMNGDGIDELAVGQYSGGGLRVFFKPGSSKAADVVPLDGTTDTRGYAFTSADVNGDGLVDLISTGGSNAAEIAVFFGSKASRIVVPSLTKIAAPANVKYFGYSLAATL